MNDQSAKDREIARLREVIDSQNDEIDALYRIKRVLIRMVKRLKSGSGVATQ